MHARPAVTDIVLIHGAWAGAWYWQFTMDALPAERFRCHALTLAGLGDRSGELTADLGMEDHVADIIEYIEAHRLQNCLLVAHSLAGIPASVALDRMPERIAGVLYLDAAVPENGKNVMDIFPAVLMEGRIRQARQFDGGVSIPPPVLPGRGNPVAAEFCNARFTPQPLKPYDYLVRLQHPLGNGKAMTYVVCGKSRAEAPKSSAPRAEAAGCRMVCVDGGHNLPVMQPELTAQLIIEMAESLSG